MYEQYLALNNLQRSICHKTLPTNQQMSGGSPYCVVANVLDSNIVFDKFELQMRIYVLSRGRYEPPYSSSNGFGSTTTLLLQGWV